MTALTAQEKHILLLEEKSWKYTGVKEQAVRDALDLSLTRYYQVLNLLLDRAEAMEFAPLVVKRLRKLRAERTRHRVRIRVTS